MAEAGQRPRTLGERVAASVWGRADPVLPTAIAVLEARAGPSRAELGPRAIALAQPGPVDPVRLARHATAAGISRALRLPSLPGALLSGRVFEDPRGWMQAAAIEAFVDQLALGGAAAAEVARLIERSGALFPSALRDELARRDIRPLDVSAEVVQSIIDRALGAPEPLGAVHLVDEHPFTGTSISQLHLAHLDGDDRVAVRSRRPGVARDLHTDAKLGAVAAQALTLIAPDAAAVGPVGFVQLLMRQHLEAIDLRYDALGLVELALVAEDSGVDALVVARPLAGYIDERALVTSDLDGTPMARHSGAIPDPLGALAALTTITLESALVHGVFWADPAPEHLVVLRDGRLGLVGVGCLGRFTPELRLAGVRVVKAVLTGDHEGMIEGMAIAGALTPDVDTAALLADLQSSNRLDPSQILFGGQRALLDALNAIVGIMLAHKLQPPVEVVLMLRTVFALGELVRSLDPDGGTALTAALLPLIPRLPAIIAAAEAAVPTS
jgi:ubiquinone biosynthesis protein